MGRHLRGVEWKCRRTFSSVWHQEQPPPFLILDPQRKSSGERRWGSWRDGSAGQRWLEHIPDWPHGWINGRKTAPVHLPLWRLGELTQQDTEVDQTFPYWPEAVNWLRLAPENHQHQEGSEICKGCFIVAFFFKQIFVSLISLPPFLFPSIGSLPIFVLRGSLSLSPPFLNMSFPSVVSYLLWWFECAWPRKWHY